MSRRHNAVGSSGRIINNNNCSCAVVRSVRRFGRFRRRRRHPPPILCNCSWATSPRAPRPACRRGRRWAGQRPRRPRPAASCSTCSSPCRPRRPRVSARVSSASCPAWSASGSRDAKPTSYGTSARRRPVWTGTRTWWARWTPRRRPAERTWARRARPARPEGTRRTCSACHREAFRIPETPHKTILFLKYVLTCILCTDG